MGKGTRRALAAALVQTSHTGSSARTTDPEVEELVTSLINGDDGASYESLCALVKEDLRRSMRLDNSADKRLHARDRMAVACATTSDPRWDSDGCRSISSDS